MKGVKGKLLKKLKTVKAIGYLKPERILQVNALDFYSNIARAPLVVIHEQFKKRTDENFLEVQQPEIIEEDQEPEFDDYDKENVRIEKRAKIGESEVCGDKGCAFVERKTVPSSEIDIASFRPPDMRAKIAESEVWGDKGRAFVERKTVPLSEIDIASFRPPDMRAKIGESEVCGDKGCALVERKTDPLSEIDIASFRPPDMMAKIAESEAWGDKGCAFVERKTVPLSEIDIASFRPPYMMAKIAESEVWGDKGCVFVDRKTDPLSKIDIASFRPPDMRAKIAESEVWGDKGCAFVERKTDPLSEIDIASFRPPDMNSGTLFDPNLLAAFEQAVMEVKASVAEGVSIMESSKSGQNTEHPLQEFPHKSPPGGSESVILYSTSLRGIRKTFDDCQKLKSLLQNLKLLFFERDVSMHSEFKQELWGMLGLQVVPPRLFVKGRYIGGAEEVLSLHEQGKFKLLVEGIPVHRNEGPCEGCAGFKFIICFNCNGSRRVLGEGGAESKTCLECNENGMMICPFCC